MFRTFARRAPALVLAAAFGTGLTPGAALAQSGYRIQPGDVLQIEVVEDSGLNRSALVLPDGSISFPLMGTLPAAGRTVDQVRDSLRDGIATNFAAPPTVFVSVGQLAAREVAAEPKGMSVYIMGAATEPGRKEVKPGTTILQFLAESGGLTRFAATKRIQLRRTDKKTGTERVYVYDYDAVQSGDAAARSIVLAPGDVIVVPERRLFE